ncbi:MAG: choice-of-anchor D domain-containing protein [Deltaproteobacteria bacterium]|jgi:hypothetical protein
MRRFTIASTGALVAALFACDNGGGLEAARGQLVFSPESIDFGEIAVGGATAQRLTVTALNVDVDATFEIDAPFRINSEAPATVPRAGIALDLGFVPTEGGRADGELRVTAGEDIYTVALTGVGTAGGLRLVYDGARCDSGGVSFGAVTRFSEVHNSFFVEAAGNLPADIVGVYLAAGSSSDLGIVAPREQRHTLQPGEQLEVELVYIPSDNGADSGEVVFELATGTTFTVSLCGIGSAVSACVEPDPLDLGAVPVGSTARGTFAIRSCNDEPLVISDVTPVNDAAHPSDPGFAVELPDRLSTPLPTNASVDITATYAANDIGEATGWLRIDTNDPLTPSHYLQVTADALPPCQLRVSPERIAFANVPLGSTQVRRALLFNDNPRDCDVVRTQLVGVDAAAFSVETSSATTLAPGAALLIPITYTPTREDRVESARLEVETNNSFVSAVDLFGAAFLDPGCQLDIRPNAVSYGAVEAGVTHTREIVVRNISQFTCEVVSGVWQSGTSAAWTTTSNFPVVLGPQQTRPVTIELDADRPGAHSGVLRLSTTDVDDATVDVAVHAITRDAEICVQPDSIDFGSPSAPAMQTVTIAACGAADLDVSAIQFAAPADPEVTLLGVPSLPTTIPAGNAVTIDVRYAPNDEFADWATLQIVSADTLRPTVSVPVRGGPQEFPPETGENLYVWQSQAIYRFPLQGGSPGAPFYGPAASPSHGCSGCHAVSPDGRYVALIEYPELVLIDTTTNIEITTGITASVESVAWNPDVNTTPPYQFVYATGDGPLTTASVTGPIGALPGTDDGTYVYKMPDWGPSGQIVAARAPSAAATTDFAFVGPVDLVLVPEGGGAPALVAGASNDGGGHYYPAWSPTGTWIAYTHSVSAATTYAAADATIRLVRANQSGTVATLPFANDITGASSYPTWSLDGRILSFSSNRSGGLGDWDVYAAFVDDANGTSSSAVPIQNINTPSFDHIAIWAR